jgi:hypothetical protein
VGFAGQLYKVYYVNLLWAPDFLAWLFALRGTLANCKKHDKK